MDIELAKQCALITINELIIVTRCKQDIGYGYFDEQTTEYWNEVKNELNKL